MTERPLDTGPTDEELPRLPTVFRDGLFAGEVVLVSGGGGGLGRAICHLFGRLGARVAACGRDQDELARLEGNLPEHKQHRIATETIEIYAPIANRLGIGWLKTEFEDLGFKFLMPKLYSELVRIGGQKKRRT